MTGVSGETLKKPFLQSLDCQMGKNHLKHGFLRMPECPIPPLGQDSLNTRVTFASGQIDINVPPEQARPLETLVFQPQKTACDHSGRDTAEGEPGGERGWGSGKRAKTATPKIFTQ